MFWEGDPLSLSRYIFFQYQDESKKEAEPNNYPKSGKCEKGIVRFNKAVFIITLDIELEKVF